MLTFSTARIIVLCCRSEAIADSCMLRDKLRPIHLMYVDVHAHADRFVFSMTCGSCSISRTCYQRAVRQTGRGGAAARVPGCEGVM